MEQPTSRPGGLFATIGGAMFQRAAALLGDDHAAIQTVESLFVRFVVHARGQALGDRARWLWIYRVVTSHCLRLMWASAPPDGPGGAPAAGAATFGTLANVDRERLRGSDEATQNMMVLAARDGLTPEEVADVLGLPIKLVRRRLAVSLPSDRDLAVTAGGAAAAAAAAAAHPSNLALDADRAAHAAHIAACGRCRGAAEKADDRAGRFAREIAPEAGPRVAAAIRAEQARHAARPRWKRALWLAGALVAVSALALLVARPRRPDRRDAAYGGLKGASRQKASGLQITVRRGEEVQALKPGAALAPGDRLHFRVRAERARYLELRVRRALLPAAGGDPDAGAGAAAPVVADVRVFPAGGVESVLVVPAQALDRDYVLDVVPPAREPVDSKLLILALFADRPFPLDRAPGPDVEVVPVRVDIKR